MSKLTRGKPSSSIQATFKASSGPLPSPEVLAQFDTVLPGLAERIVTMAENEAAHRHRQETLALEADIRIAHRDRTETMMGQVFGFIIGMTTVISGAWLIASGYHAWGAIIGSAGVVGLASVFVIGRSGWLNDKKGPPERRP